MSAAGGITDFHNHLIPGVDDGAQDPADSRVALEHFRAEGASQIVTTPHFTGSLTQDGAALAARLAEFDAGWALLQAVVREDAERMGAPLRVERGAEVMLDVPDVDLADPRLRLAGGLFALVEYPGLRLPPVNAAFALTALARRGWIPVVAHPERYRNLSASLAELAQFREAGAYLAVNAGSLFGAYGNTAAAHARRILEFGWADYVASDYHARGEPGMTRFGRALADAGFTTQAELLTMTNPARLLAGERPLAVPPLVHAPGDGKRKTLWQRLFGG